jgi:hypothetical protein
VPRAHPTGAPCRRDPAECLVPAAIRKRCGILSILICLSIFRNLIELIDGFGFPHFNGLTQGLWLSHKAKITRPKEPVPKVTPASNWLINIGSGSFHSISANYTNSTKTALVSLLRLWEKRSALGLAVEVESHT